MTLREAASGALAGTGGALGWLPVASADGGIDLGLAGGEFGRLLALDPLGDVLVVAHQGLQVGAGRVEHAQVGVGPLDLLPPQPDVPDARDDPAEQQRAEGLLYRRM